MTRPEKRTEHTHFCKVGGSAHDKFMRQSADLRVYKINSVYIYINGAAKLIVF